MASDPASEVKLEIGHVLFLDIVGYSQLLITQQSEQVETLRRIVRGTTQFRAAEAEGKLLRLPTGDGGALVFRTNPEAPVLCALEIARELKKIPELRVRMGIHSGPVNEVTDLNEQANIAGAGINIAQRVMNCGDAGHILLSRHVAEDLEHFPRWQPYLHDLGEYEVKHGGRVSLVNLYTDDAGNPEPPIHLAAHKRSPATAKRFTGFRTLLLAAIILIGLGIPAMIFTPAILKSVRPAIERDKPAEPSFPHKSIAVLPFENLSDDKSAAYFADGIQDEILTKLATIADLKVISRTSTARYKSKPEDLKTVSQQLGVATVLEGSVQKSGEKVRVNVQLIDARADSHLWAKSYDGDAKDIFKIETEVSQQVADALQAKLSPVAANAIASAPTKNPAAYDLFLRGESEERRAEDELDLAAYDRARKWYEQAIAADPGFALALARLAENRMQVHWFAEKLDSSQLQEVKAMAERAVALAPDLAQANIAVGVCYYYGSRDYDRALAAFSKAIELQPNNAAALEYSGYVHRRQGKWQQSLKELQEALERDPRNAALAGNIAGSYIAMRMWKEAEQASNIALKIDPYASDALGSVLDRLTGSGDNTAEAMRLLANFPGDSKIISSSVGDYASVIGTRAHVYVLAHDFASARKVWDTGAEEERRRTAAQLIIDYLAGDRVGANAAAEKIKVVLQQRLRDVPEDVLTMTELSWVNLALGNKKGAVEMARKAVATLPPARDALFGPATVNGLAQIQAQTGAGAEVVSALRQLLSIPAGGVVSIAILRTDPVWDPIRNDPDFAQLLTMTEHVGP